VFPLPVGVKSSQDSSLSLRFCSIVFVAEFPCSSIVFVAEFSSVFSSVCVLGEQNSDSVYRSVLHGEFRSVFSFEAI
jgi:hypothetical protein